MNIVLVTGLSGSGKSVALNVLEDAGYFCIDNLPVAFLASVVDTLDQQQQTRLAVAVDARTAGSLDRLANGLEHLRRSGHTVKVIFLTARDETLVQRYSETRRRHPLSRGLPSVTEEGAVQTLAECIRREREMLADIEPLGMSMDTSDVQPQVLRRWVKEVLNLTSTRLTLLFQSFAFKDGIPMDADVVFDARCLPNPYWVEALRSHSGLDAPVIDFLDRQDDVADMFRDICIYLEKWLPRFQANNRSYITVAIGCTGGQHRSVYLCEKLGKHFQGKGYNAQVRHKELA